MKTLAHAALGLVLLMSFAAAHADTLSPLPDPGDPCLADRQASFNDGYDAGRKSGYSEWFVSRYEQGYFDGFGAGTAKQLAQCLADPQSCGITLASCIPDPVFGETEPNDNLIAADPLKLGANFWGQSYGAADQDWFYTETTVANQNLIVNFSVPGGLLAGWKMTIRDAAGNVFANFNTAVSGGVPTKEGDEAVTYRVTLGLIGTYYIVVQPTPPAECIIIDPSDTTCAQNFSPYYISALLQDSSLDTNQPIVGFADSEIEPNNIPSNATPLATSVTMYGLVNLTFNFPVPTEDTFVWGQGEDDWYVYQSTGNEIVTLVFCAKEKCGPGNWFVEIYDRATAQRLENGESRENVQPLLAFNTDTTNDPSATYRLGLKDPNFYLMRVSHKRLFNAPCLNHQFVSTTSDTGFVGSCECESGNSCYVPADCESDDGLSCKNVPTECVAGIETGCLIIENVPPGCGVEDEEGNIEPCDTYQTQALCSCSQYGGVVEVPENAYSSPYNFTWHGTQLPPNTIDTDAYDDFLNRPNPYN
ncbi:hypothetical protein CCR95_24170 [Thiocystis minor]|nr:hypothetical protein [Thiocystis minor]